MGKKKKKKGKKSPERGGETISSQIQEQGSARKRWPKYNQLILWREPALLALSVARRNAGERFTAMLQKKGQSPGSQKNALGKRRYSG